MTARRKEVQITADAEKRTVTIRHRALHWYGSPGPWRQVTFPAREFDQALSDAKIAVPWSRLQR